MNLIQFTKLYKAAKENKLMFSDIERYRAVKGYSIDIDSTSGRSHVSFKYKSEVILFLDLPCMNALSIAIFLKTGLRYMCLDNLPVAARVTPIRVIDAEMIIEALEGTLENQINVTYMGESMYNLHVKGESLQLFATSHEDAVNHFMNRLRYLR